MMEKQEIVDTARAIGTEEFSAAIPEYCGVISVKPTTRARMHRIEREESRFDFAVLDRAIENTQMVSIDRIELRAEKTRTEIEIVSQLPSDGVVVDIRHPDEEEQKPLALDNQDVLKIPFYKLNSAFMTLEKDRQYFLYCEKGIMSKLHAAYLREQGVENVGVFRSEK